MLLHQPKWNCRNSEVPDVELKLESKPRTNKQKNALSQLNDFILAANNIMLKIVWKIDLLEIPI